MKEETKIRTLTAVLDDCASQLSSVYAKYDKQDSYTLERLNSVIEAIDLLTYEIADDLAGFSQSSKAIRAYNKMLVSLLK